MKRDKVYGINFRYFAMLFFYYGAWPNEKNGTNYWCLEVTLFNHYCFDIKIDFWNPKDMDGWVITKNSDGSKTWSR